MNYDIRIRYMDTHPEDEDKGTTEEIYEFHEVKELEVVGIVCKWVMLADVKEITIKPRGR